MKEDALSVVHVDGVNVDDTVAIKVDINLPTEFPYIIITRLETPGHYWISLRQKDDKGIEYIIKEWETTESKTPIYYEYKKSLNIPQKNKCYTFNGWKPYFDY